MVSDDLSFELLKKELDRVRKLYDEEKKKTEELTKRVQEQEKHFTGQYEKLLEVEKGIVSGEETLHTIQQEKIEALTRHLAREHNFRLDVEESKAKFEEEYRQKIDAERALRERLLAEKDKEIAALKDALKKKDEDISAEKDKSAKYEERELDIILNVMREPAGVDLVGGEDSNWITETQDLIKVLHRWGSIKLDEAAQTMGSDSETVRSYAKILKDKGLIKVDEWDGPNPTLRSTRDLVGRLNELRVKMRRRGRIQP